ncbi:polysaccharide lyase family 7 protein [Aquimarina pacifica]|uniref:polysaccharide lyase family 7 protein n=1 Tax=Aquimarina pacifica TaxID=1296415 RepID=UPI000553577A|nr:polysaccharide lyase family 7 protein [Aquimarina pacifica]
MKSLFTMPLLMIGLVFFLNSCSNAKKKPTDESNTENVDEKIAENIKEVKYPSDVIPFFEKWKILLGDGTKSKELINYENKDFFYLQNDGKTNWVVYKTPNSGITSKTSSNTRTELHQKEYWKTETGGKLTGTLKVMHVSTSGDPRVAASYSVVVGQIHSNDGHKNEPLKICYKKFPGQEKGSVYWNYEINTEGDNSNRWDFSTAVWGYDMSVVGPDATTNPEEPADGIALGEEFSYEVNVFEGIMYLTFTSEGHPTKTFTKNLLASDFAKPSDIPQQTRDLFFPIGQKGTEKPNAYKGELNYFKQGAYNQTNGKDPKKNIVWCAGAEIYNGDISKQYENGSYTEVWFKDATVGAAVNPNK